MLDKIVQFIENHHLIKQKDIIVVGLSGGPDSIFLLYILSQLKVLLNIDVIAAHLDHQWRATSADDVLFCQSFAKALGIAYVAKKASEIQLKKLPCGSSKEALGRLLRRQFLEEVLLEYKATSIALAHHWNDQEETFFIRLIRGATISGLVCMKPRNGYYIRPLLNITKNEIVNFLEHHGLAYLKDETNDLDIFLRNKIRKYILPELHRIDSRFDKNFAKTLQHIQNADDFIEDLAYKTFQEISEEKSHAIVLNKQKLLVVDKFLQPRILLIWLCKENVQFIPTDSYFKEIMRFIEKPVSNKHKLGLNWMIVKQKNRLFIEKSL